MKSRLWKTVCGLVAGYGAFVINAAHGSGDALRSPARRWTWTSWTRSCCWPGGLFLACGPVVALSVTQQDILDAVSAATAAFQAEMANRDQQLVQMQAHFQQQLGADNQAVQRASASAAAAAVPGGMADTRLIGRPDNFDGGTSWHGVIGARCFAATRRPCRVGWVI